MRNMLRCMLIPFLCLLGLFCSLQAQDAPILKIAALHPVLGDMARSIGGSRVQVADLLRPNRSEERRVGKECRSRWSPYH